LTYFFIIIIINVLFTISFPYFLQNHSTKRKSPENLQKKPEIQPETEEEQDPARVSKLFYLQLYSSVYNAAITEGRQEKSEKEATDGNKKE
jgi:hypothetical protein